MLTLRGQTTPFMRIEIHRQSLPVGRSRTDIAGSRTRFRHLFLDYMSACLLLLLSFTGHGAALATPGPPAIETRCHNDVTNEIRDKEEYYNAAHSLHVKWKATNATSVWIVGEPPQLPTEGETSSGAPVIIVAVGPGGLAQTVNGCSDYIVSRAAGYFGLVYAFREHFNLEGFAQQSFVRHLVALSYSPDVLNERLTNILQDWGYTVASARTEAIDTVFRYTPQYNDHPGLCDKDCKAHDIDKQVAFVVSLKTLRQSGLKWDY